MGSKDRRKSTAVVMVEIELDKKRKLDWDLNALTAAEKAMTDFWGKRTTMGDVLSEGSIGAADLRSMLWAGLMHEDEDLTMEQVGAMVRIDNMQYVQKILVDSLTAQGILNPEDDGASGGDSSKPNPPPVT